jgi:hypothetical protein
MVFLAYISGFDFGRAALVFRGAQAAGLHGDQAGCGADEQESVFVEAFRIAGAGLRAVDFDAAAGDPCGGLCTRRGMALETAQDRAG